jgi:tRNA (guanosine-2'-O-)-methyltransferase
MEERRYSKIKSVAYRRQGNLTVLLNNVHDPHNIGAVLRTCDSIGIKEIYVLNTDESIDKNNLVLGKKSAASARKWVDTFYYTNVEKCIADIREKYEFIYGTHLDSQAVSLYDLDMKKSVALVFGNEHAGISDEVMKHLDGNFIIPQVGMVQSLNISVAVAVTLYEAYRQRSGKGYYKDNPTMTLEDKNTLLEDYINRHNERYKGRLMQDRRS